MKATIRKREGGQALVFLAITLVGVLGFAALAIDGGNLYTEQRRAQAAADNAVMAAAFSQMRYGKTATTADLEQAALGHAVLNGYDNNQSNNWVVFFRPPLHGPYAGNDRYMQVQITQHVNTSLAHIVFGQSPIPLTVYAVAHGRPAENLMDGYAIAGMKPECTGSSMIAVEGKGGGSTGGTTLYSGGAFINAACEDALNLTGGDTLISYGGTIDVVGGVSGTTCDSPTDTSSCNVYPEPSVGVEERNQDPIAESPAGTPPPCGPAANLNTEMNDGIGDSATVKSIRPGSYTTLDPGPSFKDQLLLQPGIYCLTGGTLTAGGGELRGEGVLIYMTDAPSRIDVSGSSDRTIYLTAPTVESTGCADGSDTSMDICTYLNILVYKIAGYNTCDQSDAEIDLTGLASKYIVGLIYAPYSLVRYGGNGSLEMVGQTIAGCVKFNGNGTINIYYDPESTYSPPPAIQLDE